MVVVECCLETVMEMCLGRRIGLGDGEEDGIGSQRRLL